MLGRIKHGNHAVALLTEFDFEQAQIASEIEQYNSDRKDLEQANHQGGLTTDRMKRKNVLPVVYQENWHKGVIGIVASRLLKLITDQLWFYQKR
jgi:single-stranded-DNA-specific exonuclease